MSSGSRGRTKKSQVTVHGILFRTVGCLLFVTLLSFWLVCGLFAKYTVSGNDLDSARVAAGGSIKIVESKAKYVQNKGEFELDINEKVSANTYNKVIPGVDIPKDPFVRLVLDKAEVDYRLYMKVVKSENFPDTVTFEITDDWVKPDPDSDIYMYKTYLDAGQKYDFDNGKEIHILVEDTLYVSQYYEGKESFSLSFEVWLQQVD